MRILASLIAATVLLPLAILLLGLWQGQRGTDDWREFATEHDRLAAAVADLEARAPRDGRPDFRLQFRHDGHLYGGPYAVVKAREVRDEAGTLAAVMDWRRSLPPVAVLGGGIAATLSLLVLVVGGVLGQVGRTSRQTLVHGFSLVRRLLPVVLAAQIVAATAGFVAIVLFEAGLLIQGGFTGGGAKLLGLAAAAAGGTIIAAGGALMGLRQALVAFEPEPLPILGRQIAPAEAPGLWRLVEAIADRMGALKPEALVVGLTEGFFVSAGPAVLEPGGTRLEGRILYVPLPYLALMRVDETAAIIGHELAHYAGGDTAYSQRFLPIYTGVGRSLDALLERERGGLGLLGPSVRLGLFVMERFHLAVRHWSRKREFAADAAGAAATSSAASARALLRSGAVRPGIVDVLETAAAAPAAASSDLMAAALDRAMARGLDDPAARLEDGQAHPTDTHPPTRERIAALGLAVDADLLTAAGAPPPARAREQLAAYFTDPSGLCRAATQDFLGAVQAHAAAARAHLEATAAEVGPEDRVLRASHRARGLVLAVSGGFFAAAALPLVLVRIPGLSPDETRVLLVVMLALAAVFCVAGAFVLARGEPITLILSPTGLTAPGLDRVIPWAAIADLDMTLSRGGIAMRLLLPPGADWPERAPGRHAVKLDPKRRIVTLTAGLPRKMKPQDFADLIARYQAAHQARRLLSERAPIATTAVPLETHPA